MAKHYDNVKELDHLSSSVANYSELYDFTEHKLRAQIRKRQEGDSISVAMRATSVDYSMMVGVDQVDQVESPIIGNDNTNDKASHDRDMPSGIYDSNDNGHLPSSHAINRDDSNRCQVVAAPSNSSAQVISDRTENKAKSELGTNAIIIMESVNDKQEKAIGNNSGESTQLCTENPGGSTQRLHHSHQSQVPATSAMPEVNTPATDESIVMTSAPVDHAHAQKAKKTTTSVHERHGSRNRLLQ